MLHGPGEVWLKPLAGGLLQDASNLWFFSEIYRFIDRRIGEFQAEVLGNAMAVVGWVILSLLTIWIMLQGYRIVTGRSREPMMGFVVNMLRAMLIVFAATTFSTASGDTGDGTLSKWLSTDVSDSITWLVTGEHKSATEMIDRNLGNMQAALSSIDQLDVGGNQIVQDYKTRNLWFTGIGIAGPAITGGTMLLLNKLAMALFIGLGPIFILCLLFDQTKPLFQKWLYYGIGTMFSLAVMSAMVAISMDAVTAVAEAFWAGAFLGSNTEGINSMALQQGGLGLLLTMLIVSAPPMAAQFFQGTLGSYMSYSVFGSPSTAAAGQRPGEQGYRGGVVPAKEASTASPPSTTNNHAPYRPSAAPQQDVIRQGKWQR
jgi:type IV secretion system protein VirB6